MFLKDLNWFLDLFFKQIFGVKITFFGTVIVHFIILGF
jgi:hypothetical protein